VRPIVERNQAAARPAEALASTGAA